MPHAAWGTPPKREAGAGEFLGPLPVRHPQFDDFRMAGANHELKLGFVRKPRCKVARRKKKAACQRQARQAPPVPQEER